MASGAWCLRLGEAVAVGGALMLAPWLESQALADGAPPVGSPETCDPGDAMHELLAGQATCNGATCVGLHLSVEGRDVSVATGAPSPSPELGGKRMIVRATPVLTEAGQ